MEQIKFRVNGIARALSERSPEVFDVLDAEFVALQCRKVFELVAYSSLCAHRELFEGIRARIDRESDLAQIVRTIERVHPHFFPVPGVQRPSTEAGVVAMVEPQTRPYMSHQELVKAHGRIAVWLHAHNPYRQSESPQHWHALFQNWNEKILALLNHHQVHLINRDVELWCIMNGQDGRIHAFEMERIPPEAPKGGTGSLPV